MMQTHAEAMKLAIVKDVTSPASKALLTVNNTAAKQIVATEILLKHR